MSPTAFSITCPCNLTYHHLCKKCEIPPFIKKYLGLGLKFCPTPSTSSSSDQVDLTRFHDDNCPYIFFSTGSLESDFEKPPLYVPSNRVPPIDDLYIERLHNFGTSIRNTFSAKKLPPNLSVLQQKAQDWLLTYPEVTVLNADKNLGPITMDRDEYVMYAYKDHLHDRTTCKRLTIAEKSKILNDLDDKIHSFTDLWSNKKKISKMDSLWISRRHTVPAPSYMYLLAKIHKNPLKTCPIISYSGSVCSGIAKWLDLELKKNLPHLPYIVTSSITIAQDPQNTVFTPGTQLLTMDATAMYTNIHLGHALPALQDFLCNSTCGKEIVSKAQLCPVMLLHALEIVMNNSMFAFGDTFWLQTAGTAMDTPPAPTWATIYFCLWELVIIPELDEIKFYKRYIDDGFATWQVNPT